MSTRLDIRNDFRGENPEITANVISDAVLNSWLLKGNKEVCAATFCIVTNASVTFNTVINTQYYDLEANVAKFYAIDDMPGGGVFYNNKSLKKITPGEMNFIRRNWKTADAGTPLRYWVRGKYLWFEKAPDAVVQVAIDAYLIPDPFDDDAKTPYNQLAHLEPFHDALSKYLQWKCKEKIGKDDEGARAKAAYIDYVKWMKKKVKGSNQSAVFMRPSSSNSGLARF